METTLNEFLIGVRQALGRGAKFDDVIKARTRQAVRWIERNINPGYKYMERFKEVVINSEGNYPQIMDLPNSRIKAVLMLRIVNADGTYSYLTKIHPKDTTALDEAKPQGYWVDGLDRLILDSKPDQDYNAEMLWVEYSAWSSSDTFTHWLLEYAEDLLFAQVMLNLSAWTRDPKMLQTYKQNRDEALITMEGQRIDLEFENTDEAMMFGGDV